jgi:transcriptional regulator with XRE-family HTH domain
MSQESVAREAGLTVGSFARIERGEANPSWTSVRRILDALELSLSELAAVLDEERRPQP